MEENQDLVEQLQYLNETKGLIKQAIINKGQSISAEDTFRSYVDKINNITTSEDLEAELSAQETLIQQMKIALENKTAGGDDATYEELFAIASSIYNPDNIPDDSATVEFTEDDEYRCLSLAINIAKGV